MTEKEKLNAGWGWPPLASKAHWFDRGEIIPLCSRWMDSGERHPGTQLDGPNDCKACTRVLKRRAKIAEAETPPANPDQQALFDVPAPDPAKVKAGQDKGRRLRDDAVSATATKNPKWVKFAGAYARQFAIQHGRVTSDDIHEYSERVNWEPNEGRAYGAVFRGKGWRKLGTETSRRPVCHARPVTIWAYTPPEGGEPRVG